MPAGDTIRMRAPRLAAAAALAALLLAFHAPLWQGPQATWLAGTDNAYQVLPWLEMQAREWRAGRIPLWDPWQWMGQPLPGQMQPAVTAPANLIFLPLKPETKLPILFWNLYFLCIRWGGAVGAYRLARSLGCRRASALLAGFSFATLGWFAFAMRPQMAMSAMWAPWALMYLLRAAERADGLRQAALGGFFLGLCWLGGHHQAPLFISVGFLLIWAGFLVSSPRRWRAAAVFWMLALTTAAVALLPAMEYGRRAVRWVGTAEPLGWRDKIPYEIHRQYSLPVDALPALFWPGYQGKPEAFHGSLFIFLAVFSVFAARKRPAAAALGGLGAMGVLLAIGPAGGLHPLLYRLLPHFDKARTPEAALILLSLAVPALAAAGVEHLAEQPTGSKWRNTFAAALWLLAAGTAAAAWRTGSSDLRWLTAAGVAVAGVLVWISRLRRLPAGLLAAACLAVGWAEARPLYSYVLARTEDPRAMSAVACLQSHGDVAEFLRVQGGFWRIDVDDADIPCNFGDWHGLPQAQGYLASVTENLYRHELHTEWGKRLFGVRFRVARTPSPTHHKEVFAGAGGIRVFERGDVLPRVFAVHEAEPLRDRRQAAGALYRMREEIAAKTFLPGPVPVLDRCAGRDEAHITSYEPGRVLVEARMACRGMLILTDTWYPGWRAAVDGRAARIHEAYAAVRGVVVEAGRHTVEFRYAPLRWYAGAALTLASALLAAACAAWRRIHW
jgi:hypothetical protein